MKLNRALSVLPAALAAVLAFPSTALALVGDRIRIEPSPWMQDFTGTGRIDGDFLSGTEFDFADDLGLGGEESVPGARIQLRIFKKSKFLFEAFDMSRSGTGSLTTTFTFNDTVYTAGETVDSQYDLSLFRMNFRHPLVDAKVVEAGFDLTLNLAQAFVSVDGSVSGTASFDEDIPFPTAGGYVVVKPFPGFGIRAEVNGFGVGIGGNSVEQYDLRAQVEWYFLHVFGLFAGYRDFHASVESDEYGEVVNDFKGPYFGLGFKF